LLEPVGKILRQGLAAPIGFRHYDRPKLTDTSGIGILSALPEQGKAGYFDLILRTKTSVENSSPERPADAPDARWRRSDALV